MKDSREQAPNDNFKQHNDVEAGEQSNKGQEEDKNDSFPWKKALLMGALVLLLGGAVGAAIGIATAIGKDDDDKPEDGTESPVPEEKATDAPTMSTSAESIMTSTDPTTSSNTSKSQSMRLFRCAMRFLVTLIFSYFFCDRWRPHMVSHWTSLECRR